MLAARVVLTRQGRMLDGLVSTRYTEKLSSLLEVESKCLSKEYSWMSTVLKISMLDIYTWHQNLKVGMDEKTIRMAQNYSVAESFLIVSISLSGTRRVLSFSLSFVLSLMTWRKWLKEIRLEGYWQNTAANFQRAVVDIVFLLDRFVNDPLRCKLELLSSSGAIANKVTSLTEGSLFVGGQRVRQ